MREFIRRMCDILDDPDIDASRPLVEFANWDSLAALSFVVMASEDYGVTLTNQDVRTAETVEALFLLIKGRQSSHL